MFGKLFSGKNDLSVGLFGRIIATDPIVTISKRTPLTPLGIAGVAPDFFRGKNAFHILSNTWHHRSENKVRRLGRDLRRLSSELQNNHFLYLGNDNFEVLLLSKHKVPAILSSELIAIDDSIFRPGAGQTVKITPTDVVYVARIKEMKRHELAYDLENVALVYGRDDVELQEQIRKDKPQWLFVNHVLGNGDYYRLSVHDIAGVLNQCRVGLCLSPEEGAMRASMEYLMSGLPIVSTYNFGGRDRYLDPFNSIHVESTRKAVREGVESLLDNPRGREEIRENVMHKVNFDREDFINSVNEVIQHHYGVHDHLKSCRDIIGYLQKYRPASVILADLDKLK